MDQADPHRRQRRLQGLEGGLRGLRDDLVGIVDEGADPVRLPPLRAGIADPRDQVRAPPGGQCDGGDRGTSRRQFVDGGDVEVGVGRHRQRARDRGGGHHQLVRHAAPALVAQGQPLVHAEAVLFVDDRQGEVVELDPFLHQCMGADHHLRRAGGHRFARLGARLAGDLAGQPGDLDAQRLQPSGQVGVMLFGQQFGGGPSRAPPRLHRQQRSHRRATVFAAAHVPCTRRAWPRQAEIRARGVHPLRARSAGRQRLAQGRHHGPACNGRAPSRCRRCAGGAGELWATAPPAQAALGGVQTVDTRRHRHRAGGDAR